MNIYPASLMHTYYSFLYVLKFTYYTFYWNSNLDDFLFFFTRCKFGQLGPGKGQFNSPHGFCLGLEEDIIVADTNNHRIQVFEKSGDFKYQFGIPGKYLLHCNCLELVIYMFVNHYSLSYNYYLAVIFHDKSKNKSSREISI